MSSRSSRSLDTELGVEASNPSSSQEKGPAVAPTVFRNPFLPPDKDLWVGHLSPTHTLVLNKFNVVPHHSIVVSTIGSPHNAHVRD